ncbi:class I SAM-dependent methyltransferase [Azospirillum sp. RWY-5-1]|uniref:Class I SAM-dependent methyltransferase n=1 Tax=Azospirillum oleiclasticum TaxID=2735135 RepID=A0ABX2TMW4_9PROT|nr:class I SAM-dependent methyltransferase [Azospirillum oleiclasticum]NYZ17510.1 class I SAM-dependent methyltransferase [Azospirillum oleiclasticum]NYZ24888.1 class I SAM-dependent methyltransferase [Azospirillum oleiclasticum]
MPRLTIEDFARAFGVPATALAPETLALIDGANLGYRRLEREERDRLILGVIERLEGGGLTQVGAHRDRIWDGAWGDMRTRFHEAGQDLEALNPTFVGGSRLVRIAGDYAEADDPRFELSAFEVFRDWLFRAWLAPFGSVLEFGCGSGFNLAALARLAPDKRLTGLDWSPASVGLIGDIADHHGFDLTGLRFDFFDPDPGLSIGRGDAVMTFCALEQVGSRFGPFLDFLLEKRPGLCLHMEPTLEHYDPASLPDALAIRYHRYRRYLDGYLTRLRELEAEGRARIRVARRLGWGSLYQECYSLTIWEPL